MKQSKPDESNEEFDIYADELEYEWKTSRPRLTEKQMVEIFSPPREMIFQKLDDWETKRAEVIENLKHALKGIYQIESDEFSHWFGAYMVRLQHQPELEECNRQIKRLRRVLKILTPATAMNIGSDDIEKARKYSIIELAQGSLDLRRSGNKYVSLCPYHDEKHASFYLYPETNTFHCFGCLESGDVIKLAMHLHGASFLEAVALLQR